MLKSAFLPAVACLLLTGAPAHAQRNLTVAAPPASEQRVALVIGNSAYSEAPLKNPVNDATDVAAALRDLGFQVTLRTNARQRDMKQAIREFGEQLARGGVGLFYFAGHGVQSRGRNFLMPIGAQIEREAHVEDESVDANFVLAQMEEARNRVNIVILDACRNNPYSRGFRSASRGLAQMDATSGTLIAFATSPGSVAADGDGRNGVYTKHLLRQVRDPGLPVELMLKRVRDGVMSETKDRQVPWESSSLRGADFYFRPTSTAPSIATPAPAPADRASHLRRANEHLARGNRLVMLGKEREADMQYAPAYGFLRELPPADLDDESKVALGRLTSRIGRDPQAALAILAPLAEKGNAAAQNTYGALIRDVRKNDQEAVQWWRKSAEQGHPWAQGWLASAYSEGRGVPKDEREAFAWRRKSAEQGYVPAQNSVGIMYQNGRGVEKDERQAALWYRKAAEAGHPGAQHNLGVLYRDGRGLDKDDRQAAVWLRKSAEQGNALAQNLFGIHCRDGRGVAKDEREAALWFRKSADQGNQHAQNNLGFMYEKGTGVPKDVREAAYWYEKAASQGNQHGQNNLGLAYENGRGLDKDLGKAASWFEKSAAQGNEKARNNLDRLKTR